MTNVQWGAANKGWGNASNWARRRRPGAAAPAGFNPRQGTNMAGSSWNNPVLQDPNYNTFTVDYADPADYGGTTDWGAMGADLANQPGGGGRKSITFGGEPAYRGILDRYTADWRARLNAGLGAMRQSTLSGQRGMINRLGVRDPAAMMAALKAKGVTGITLADLQKAAENPFSDLMALDKRARGGRSTLSANLGARGGVRSGAATKGVTDIENERARAEALATEEALTGIGSSQSQLDNWAREQEDQLFQRSFDLEQQLAQMYQPRTAFWDDQYGGYVHGGYVYDQSGNVIGTV